MKEQTVNEPFWQSTGLQSREGGDARARMTNGVIKVKSVN